MRIGVSTSSGHCAAIRQAWDSTSLPSVWIRPVLSATGMNTSGGTTPSVSSVQRASASAATGRADGSVTIGW